MKPKHPDDGMACPLWRKACVKVCHTCEWWQHVRGKNPQTGQDLDHWACSIAMQVMLSVENTMAQRQTTATVDHLRREVQQANDAGMASALMGLNRNVERLAGQDGGFVTADAPHRRLGSA